MLMLCIFFIVMMFFCVFLLVMMLNILVLLLLIIRYFILVFFLVLVLVVFIFLMVVLIGDDLRIRRWMVFVKYKEKRERGRERVFNIILKGKVCFGDY